MTGWRGALRWLTPGRTDSIRRTLVVGATTFVAVMVMVVVGFARINESMRVDLTEATAGLIEERRIAERLVRAVSRQLVAVSSFVGDRDQGFIADFRGAGDAAYVEIQHYLFRDLTTDQRIQLEAVREEHQRLEVAASRAFEGSVAGRTADVNAATQSMIDHAGRLQDAVDRFLELRQAHLASLSAQQERTFRYISLGLAALALTLLLGITFFARFLYRRLARPIIALTDAATAVEEGDYETRVHVPFDDEFAEVAQAFNRMADSLVTAKDRLEERNQTLQETLAELQAAQDELIQSEKMSATGRMMAGLAHELNNPLASVLGYGELLSARLEEGEPPTVDELRETIDPMVDEAARARTLVHNLLRFSRRSDGQVQAVPLREALEVVVGLRDFALKQAGIELVVDRVPDGYVRAEQQRLQQVFLNVINNALDAMTPAGGVLRIFVQPHDNTVAVHFEDTGPGFDDPERAFEPFYTTKGVGEGTGLGLALVHRFMQAFGGSSRVENRPEGGARVTLTFQTAHDPELGAGTAVRAKLDQRVAATAEVVGTAGPGGMRVLVVEDEAPLRELQRRMLSRLDAEVLTAGTSQEAIRILEQQDVELVVSDVKMPGGSGLDLFHWVEAHRPALVDHFLFVTGDIGDPEIALFAETEPDRFVHKPFQMTTYLDRISAALR